MDGAACPHPIQPCSCENRWLTSAFHMDLDTSIGGNQSRFPETRRSAILDLASEDPARLAAASETLIAGYWKPVYKYIRVRWNQSNEDAKDLTQAFFTRVLEKQFFTAYDPAKARFRTYLRTCLDAFLSNESKAASRVKRVARPASSHSILKLPKEKSGNTTLLLPSCR